MRVFSSIWCNVVFFNVTSILCKCMFFSASANFLCSMHSLWQHNNAKKNMRTAKSNEEESNIPLKCDCYKCIHESRSTASKHCGKHKYVRLFFPHFSLTKCKFFLFLFFGRKNSLHKNRKSTACFHTLHAPLKVFAHCTMYCTPFYWYRFHSG